MGTPESRWTDVLVVGTGFAGLWAAIAAHDAGASVAIVDKASIGRSSQSRMSAGATIYCLPEDDLDTWADEFASAQAGLSRVDLVRDMLASSHERLERLQAWGVQYDPMRLPSRGFQHVKMHVRPRWRSRMGGSAVTGALRQEAVRRRPQMHGRVLVTALVLDAAGRACGVVGVDRSTGETIELRAGAVVLAAGDCSFRGNYACTDAVTGDAFRLLYDAGARLANMEFLCTNTGSPHFGFEGTGVATRAGGHFVDEAGTAFMAAHHPDGDCAEVCHIAQAMAIEHEAGHGPFRLDLTAHAAEGSFLRYALANMGGFMAPNLAMLAERGIDVFETPQAWVPAVQTLRGGAWTDIDAATDVPGLYAAGLAQSLDPGLFNGWSSMRAMWSGERAGNAAARFARGSDSPTWPDDEASRLARAAVAPLQVKSGPRPDDLLDRLQESLFSYKVSILKDRSSLENALRVVEKLNGDDIPAMRAEGAHDLAKAHETAAMATTAQLFLQASIEREESRGDHYRRDFPDSDDRWLRWVTLRRGDDGRPVVGSEQPAAPATARRIGAEA